ncbi:MAG: hypothetical protein IPL52_05740 [Flavobacteriales bacterium]|nr:hypothetical protein [Flavobacteriales bacterium]
MSTHAADRIDQQGDFSLGNALALRSAGLIEVLRITRLVRKTNDALRFAGSPVSPRTRVRELEVSFVPGDALAPVFDTVSGLLRLFYPERERSEVERLLTSKRSRYCYFWHSNDGEQRHAWLLSSP